jgi:hypothetical protein
MALKRAREPLSGRPSASERLPSHRFSLRVLHARARRRGCCAADGGSDGSDHDPVPPDHDPMHPSEDPSPSNDLTKPAGRAAGAPLVLARPESVHSGPTISLERALRRHPRGADRRSTRSGLEARRSSLDPEPSGFDSDRADRDDDAPTQLRPWHIDHSWPPFERHARRDEPPRRNSLRPLRPSRRVRGLRRLSRERA